MVRCLLAESRLSMFLPEELVFTEVFQTTGRRTPGSACSSCTRCCTGRSRTCDFFEPSVPGPLCTSKRTLKGLISRRWKEQDLRRLQSCHPPHHEEKERYNREAFVPTPATAVNKTSAQTIPSSIGEDDHTATSQLTTFCPIFAITLLCWNLFPVLLLATLPFAGIQPIRRWPTSWRRLVRLPGGMEGRRIHCKRGL